jgi:hypothetical protein
MEDALQRAGELMRTVGLYGLNGLLALAYTAWEQKAAILTLAAFAALLGPAPVVQRPWIACTALAATLAAFFVPLPVPFLMAAMALAGAGAVAVDRFDPDGLRWRASGALALYAGAALAYLAYSRYLSGADATAWAAAIGGQDEAQAALSQGRSFLNTLATWGLWLILPLGYLSLLVQGLLVHPPVGARPADTITAVRTRGQGGQ